MDLLNIGIKSIFTENIILAYFLGMCSFLALSKNITTSIGLGMAVTFVLTITAPVNWLIHRFILSKGALSWISKDLSNIDLSFLTFISFIAVIAAIVQILEMIIEKTSYTFYNTLGIYLPLITVNCAILGVSLFMIEREYTMVQSIVFGFSSGLGWLLAIVAMAAVRYKLRYSDIPEGMRGLGITMLVTGLMAIAFMIFSGIDLGK